MGIAKQYECPKCGYKPPILHFGCGFHLSYEVYVCKVCKTLQSSLCHIHSSYRKDEEKEYLEETVLIPNITNNIEIEDILLDAMTVIKRLNLMLLKIV